MDDIDLKICNEIHSGLTAPERGNQNYLFLSPVDEKYAPGYLTVIKRPMDLGTLKTNLDKGVYASRNDFYSDCQLIFENALLYNKDIPDNKFVLDPARSMMRAFEKLRKAAERKAARLSGGTVKPDSEGKPSGNSSSTTGKKKISIKVKRKKSTAETDEPPKKKPKLKLKMSSDKSSFSTLSNAQEVEDLPMTPSRRAQCYKIYNSLKRRRPTECRWFLKPVTDPMIVRDYKEKIKRPMDLGTISQKLDKNKYNTVGEFVDDLRLIASNCLIYNTTINDSFRPVAVDFLTTAEELCGYFILKHDAPKKPYRNILYCWVECMKVIDEAIKLTNPDDGHQTAWFFLHPVNYFCGGQWPDGYLDKIEKPIDLGCVVQNLLLGEYDSVDEFVHGENTMFLFENLSTRVNLTVLMFNLLQTVSWSRRTVAQPTRAMRRVSVW